MCACEERNSGLYAALITDRSVQCRDALIAANYGLVYSRVRGFLRKFPTLRSQRNDLESQGKLGLVQAVERLRQEDVDVENLEGYLSVAISREIGKFADSASIVNISERTRYRHRRKGTSLKNPTVVGINETLEFHDTDLATRELLDSILGLCQSDAERQIVRMRAEGHDDAEISEATGLPLAAVVVIRQFIHDRFEESEK